MKIAAPANEEKTGGRMVTLEVGVRDPISLAPHLHVHGRETVEAQQPEKICRGVLSVVACISVKMRGGHWRVFRRR
jgi:hypothetical protein